MYKVENIKTTLAEIERFARSPEHAEMRRRVVQQLHADAKHEFYNNTAPEPYRVKVVK